MFSRCWAAPLIVIGSFALVLAADMECPKCHKKFDSGKFCPECGEKLQELSAKPRCSKCGKEYPEGTKFCSEDGTKLSPSGQPEPALQPAARTGVLAATETVPSYAYPTVDLGSGFDSTSLALADSRAIEGKVTSVPRLECTTDAEYAASVNEASRLLGSSADARFSLGIAKVALKKQKERETSSGSKHSYLIATYRVSVRRDVLAEPALASAARSQLQESAKTEQGLVEWHRKHGTHFVSEAEYGGVLSLIMEFDHKSDAEKFTDSTHIEAGVSYLKAAGIGGGVGKDRQEKSQTVLDHAKLEIYELGGSAGTSGTPSTIDEFLALRESFLKSVQEKPVIISFKTRSYYDVVREIPECKTVVAAWKERRSREVETDLKETCSRYDEITAEFRRRAASPSAENAIRLVHLDEIAKRGRAILAFLESKEYARFVPEEERRKVQEQPFLKVLRKESGALTDRLVSSVSVDAKTERFAMSDVELEPGDLLFVESEGRWSIAGGDGASQPKYGWVDAEGHPDGYVEARMTFSLKPKYTNGKWGALVTGFFPADKQEPEWLLFGDRATAIAARGRIGFIMNDANGQYSNNAGALNVRVIRVRGLSESASQQAPAQGNENDNPEYLSWKNCRVGSFVTTITKMDTGATRMECETTTTLVEVTPEKAVVESKARVHMGANVSDQPAQKREIPARIRKLQGGTNGEKPKEGDEEVEIAGGKKVRCHWVESRSQANGSTTHAKVWQSQEVPGLLVKLESRTEGKVNSTMSLAVQCFDRK